MKDNLLIVGAGGHGKSVADVALAMKRWNKISFLDDDQGKKSVMGIEIIGTTNDIFAYKDDFEMFIGIGNNITRQKLQKMLEASGIRIPVLIHPQTVIGTQVEIGIGTVIMAGAIVNCSTKVGEGCIINTGATIDHDNRVGDFVHLSPGTHLAGTVTVGKGCWLGIGSVVGNNVTITPDCTIGAGAVVVKDLTEAGVYTGVPARKRE